MLGASNIVVRSYLNLRRRHYRSNKPRRNEVGVFSSAEAGKRAAAPFPAPLSPLAGSIPPLRSGQVLLDEAEHFRHNRNASVATLRKPFAFGPECPSSCLRNQRSPSPESAVERFSQLDQMRQDGLAQLGDVSKKPGNEFPALPASALLVEPEGTEPLFESIDGFQSRLRGEV